MLIIEGKEWKKGTILENAHLFFANLSIIGKKNWQSFNEFLLKKGSKFFLQIIGKLAKPRNVKLA